MARRPIMWDYIESSMRLGMLWYMEGLRMWCEPFGQKDYEVTADEFGAKLAVIDDIRPHGDNLTIVSVAGHEVVANRKSNGDFRWRAGETCIYVPEGAIIPDDVLIERGYWDEEKQKGLLEGKKGNRVKMRRFAGHESRGLLFKVSGTADGFTVTRGENIIFANVGDDVTEFLGITEHVPG